MENPMETKLIQAFRLPSHHHHCPPNDFHNILHDFELRISSQQQSVASKSEEKFHFAVTFPAFASLSLSTQNPTTPTSSSTNFMLNSSSSDAQNAQNEKPTDDFRTKLTSSNYAMKSMMKTVSSAERALIGAGAGGIAGAFTYFCLHPLDTIKTKLQTRGAAELYSGVGDAVVKTFSAKGIIGFYRGVSAVIVGSAASSAIYFGTCEFGKSFLSKSPQFPTILIPPCAGAMGNVVSSLIMVPKELITQRIQAGAAGRSWEVFLRIIEKDGILGLYTGYTATLLRNLPTGVLSYSSFEYLKAGVMSNNGKGRLEPLESVLCGALAGAISASITTPLDVVKTRLMTQGTTGQAAGELVYHGVWPTIREIVREEGWLGLSRGMGPRVVHSACFAALGYFAFETARMALLQRYLEKKEKSLEVEVIER